MRLFITAAATMAALAATLSSSAFAAERCLIADRIDGFSDASRDAVTLSAIGRDYRVTFIAPCLGLDTAISVAAVARTSCFDAGDTLRFEDGTGFPQLCVAGAVKEIPKDAPQPSPTPAP